MTSSALDSAASDDSVSVRPNDRLFYGWVIVGVMAATAALSMSLGGLNFGFFIKPIGDELGVGRATFGWAQSARQFASALTAPVVGGLLDRFGARILLAAAAVIAGGAMACLALVDDGWQIVLLFAVTGLVGLNGPGALVTSVPVTRWFVRRRGKAMAIASLGIPIGGVVFVPTTQALIDTFGWREAMIVLGSIGGGTIVPLPARFLGAGGFLLLAFASLLSIVADSHPMMFVAMGSFGLGIGGMMLMQNFMWADYFGRRHQGSIRGAVTPITLVCAGAGPPLAGYVRDQTGSYSEAWLAATCLMVLGAVVLALTPPPRAPRPAEASIRS